jgi:hypothetical protein
MKPVPLMPRRILQPRGGMANQVLQGLSQQSPTRNALRAYAPRKITSGYAISSHANGIELLGTSTFEFVPTFEKQGNLKTYIVHSPNACATLRKKLFSYFQESDIPGISDTACIGVSQK